MTSLSPFFGLLILISLFFFLRSCLLPPLSSTLRPLSGKVNNITSWAFRLWGVKFTLKTLTIELQLHKLHGLRFGPKPTSAQRGWWLDTHGDIKWERTMQSPSLLLHVKIHKNTYPWSVYCLIVTITKYYRIILHLNIIPKRDWTKMWHNSLVFRCC